MNGIVIASLPPSWKLEEAPGRFLAPAIGASGMRARMRVFTPLEQNSDYLLDCVGTRVDGPLGRPEVVTLPRELADGIGVLAFDVDQNDDLFARIDLVRRAWDLDVVVSARTAEVEVLEPLGAALVQLLAAVEPAESAAVGVQGA